jgi:hypothetical protein
MQQRSLRILSSLLCAVGIGILFSPVLAGDAGAAADELSSLDTEWGFGDLTKTIKP